MGPSEQEEVRQAVEKTLRWCCGEGEYEGLRRLSDDLNVLADEVVPTLDRALEILKRD